jgi:arsenical pump membrane protein
VALVALCIVTGRLPWRDVPYEAVVLALSLGTLAVRAAANLDPNRMLAAGGVGGEVRAFGAAVVGANAMNNLPALLVALPTLDAHREHLGVVLLGVNLGPVRWVTGALSTLLWQASMARLNLPVSNRRYASVGARVGIPALAGALSIHLVIGALI